jgi:micrococcal nuclease
MKKIFIALFLFGTVLVSAQEITPTLENIASFEGKTITICEKVTGIHETKGGNALLNFGKPFPDNAFSVVVFKLDREAFSYDPLTLDTKTICVTGTVILYKGKPEIIVKKETEIVVK